MSIRDDVVDRLREILGPDVSVIPYQDNLDTLERRTVMVKQQTITRLPEAPASKLRVDYVLSFISPAIDPSVAEADLDEWLPVALADALNVNWLSWDSAEKVLFAPLNLAYDVSAYLITEQKPEE